MNKTILITGAGSGIGKDSALALAKRGHTVIATTETETQVNELINAAKEKGLTLEVKKLDITNENDVQSVAQYELDVLINVAGMGESGPLAEVPIGRIRKNFETNVFGTLAITQTALKKMLQRKTGTVIVVSSIAGRMPTAFMNPYSMTKFALSGGIAAMREEVHQVAPNVHISLVEPGAYATGFNQQVFATKYEWMKDGASFWNIEMLKKQDESFKKFEEQSTDSIVKKIVQAAEADKPRLRYVAPAYQAFFVWLMRTIGK